MMLTERAGCKIIDMTMCCVLKKKEKKMNENSEKVGLKFNIQKMKIITSWEIDWETAGNSVRLLFFWAPKSLQMVTAAMKLKDAYSLEGKL